MKDDLVNYYSSDKPADCLLKEALERCSIEDLKKLQKGESATGLDSCFLKDAMEFLKLAMINLLCYKFLMQGKYLAWGNVTLYYSRFYFINSLLRMKGYAISHVTKLENSKYKIFRLRVERTKVKNEYEVKEVGKGVNIHRHLWSKFSKYYPELCSEELGRYMIDDRIRWNYDLLFPSQSTEKYAIGEAEKRWTVNFLDPNYGTSYSEEEAEYWGELMAEYGHDEAGTWDYIQTGLKQLLQIALRSRHKESYRSYFIELKDSLHIFESHPDTIKEIEGSLQQLISKV